MVVSIGLRGIGIEDVFIPKAVYNRDRALACLSHFKEAESEDQKARLLNVLKIPVYELRKPLPVVKVATLATPDQPEGKKIAEVAKVASHDLEFTLPSATVEAGDSAGRTLAKLGYQVRYLRDPESARKALAEVLNAGHRLLGLDLETMPKPAYSSHLKAGLDPFRADIRLTQVATPDGKVLVFDHNHIPVNLLDPLMQQPWTAHNAGFEW